MRTVVVTPKTTEEQNERLQETLDKIDQCCRNIADFARDDILPALQLLADGDDEVREDLPELIGDLIEHLNTRQDLSAKLHSIISG